VQFVKLHLRTPAPARLPRRGSTPLPPSKPLREQSMAADRRHRPAWRKRSCRPPPLQHARSARSYGRVAARGALRAARCRPPRLGYHAQRHLETGGTPFDPPAQRYEAEIDSEATSPSAGATTLFVTAEVPAPPKSSVTCRFRRPADSPPARHGRRLQRRRLKSAYTQASSNRDTALQRPTVYREL
jgi:hypothetical protein